MLEIIKQLNLSDTVDELTKELFDFEKHVKENCKNNGFEFSYEINKLNEKIFSICFNDTKLKELENIISWFGYQIFYYYYNGVSLKKDIKDEIYHVRNFLIDMTVLWILFKNLSLTKSTNNKLISIIKEIINKLTVV